MIFRKIRKKDLADLFAVRVVTRENRLSLEQLAGLGITSESVAELLESTYRGWLCADDGKIVGFAIGNRENGEM